jgi:6-phosphogluconate dehydrogenase (decarboxylating)
MSVKYKLSQIVDHSHPSRNGKWFARVCVSGVVHTPELADMITRRCTATEADHAGDRKEISFTVCLSHWLRPVPCTFSSLDLSHS